MPCDIVGQSRSCNSQLFRSRIQSKDSIARVTGSGSLLLRCRHSGACRRSLNVRFYNARLCIAGIDDKLGVSQHFLCLCYLLVYMILDKPVFQDRSPAFVRALWLSNRSLTLKLGRTDDCNRITQLASLAHNYWTQ
jgi:hypothetical protein